MARKSDEGGPTDELYITHEFRHPPLRSSEEIAQDRTERNFAAVGEMNRSVSRGVLLALFGATVITVMANLFNN